MGGVGVSMTARASVSQSVRQTDKQTDRQSQTVSFTACLYMRGESAEHFIQRGIIIYILYKEC